MQVCFATNKSVNFMSAFVFEILKPCNLFSNTRLFKIFYNNTENIDQLKWFTVRIFDFVVTNFEIVKKVKFEPKIVKTHVPICHFKIDNSCV